MVSDDNSTDNDIDSEDNSNRNNNINNKDLNNQKRLKSIQTKNYFTIKLPLQYINLPNISYPLNTTRSDSTNCSKQYQTFYLCRLSMLASSHSCPDRIQESGKKKFLVCIPERCAHVSSSSAEGILKSLIDKLVRERTA